MTTEPKISVCMATFNGERYVATQIASILPQLKKDDELIIVDDASHDETVKNILAFADARIQLTIRKTNQGVVATFEEAVRQATGRFIFLSDMDDTWAPNKVARFIEAFKSVGNIGLIHSARNVIDEHGDPLTSYQDNRTPFNARFIQNVLENLFQGSAMAFDASLLPKILPFPRNKLFFHDVWIGTRAALVRHPIVHIDEPLINYRIHPSNFSMRLTRRERILLRLQLFWEHLKRLISR